jgi:hypothetical protein
MAIADHRSPTFVRIPYRNLIAGDSSGDLKP